MATTTHTPPTTRITDLTDAERTVVLRHLLEAHPELREEAEQLAAAAADDVDREDVAAMVVEVYLDQSFMEIGDRCGRQPGRGYVHEADAQWELLEEALEPFLGEVDRLVGIDHPAAARTQAIGVLDGLARLREEAGEETLIGWGDVREHTHILADWARRRADEAGIDLAGTDAWDGS